MYASQTREEWLGKAVERLAPLFGSIGAPLSGDIRVSVGFPSRAARAHQKRHIGECWSPKHSAAQRHEIFISPVLEGCDVSGIDGHDRPCIVTAPISRGGPTAERAAGSSTCLVTLHSTVILNWRRDNLWPPLAGQPARIPCPPLRRLGPRARSNSRGSCSTASAVSFAIPQLLTVAVTGIRSQLAWEMRPQSSTASITRPTPGSRRPQSRHRSKRGRVCCCQTWADPGRGERKASCPI